MKLKQFLQRHNNPQSMSTLLIMASYFPFLGQHDFVVNLILSFGMLANLIFNHLKTPFPKSLVWGLSLSSLVLVYYLYGTFRGLNPGIELLTLLALAKSLELKDRRDFFILTLIIELSLIGHLLSVESLFMVLYIIMISVLLFSLLFSFHRNKKIILLNKGRLKVLGKIFLWSMPITMIMFLVFPRIYIGNYFPSYKKNLSKIGFSRELNPGSFADIVADKTPIFRAKFLDGAKVTQPNLYWRGVVLSQTDGFNWREEKLSLDPNNRLGKEITGLYQIDFDVLEAGPVFTLKNTRAIKLISRGGKYNNSGETFKVIPYSNQKVRFVGNLAKPTQVIPKLENREKYLRLPTSISSNVRKLARELEGQALNSWEASQNIMQHFFKEKFIYTLSPGRYETNDPLEEFLLQKRRGFCEHYASAAAILFRIIGIPTRIVTGFQGGTYNEIGNYYIIRGEDAHAWVEAWFSDRGWVRLDPTSYVAPTRIERGANIFFLQSSLPDGTSLEDALAKQRDSLWQKISFTFDLIYYRANQAFLDYDLQAQFKFLNSLGVKVSNFRHLIILCLVLCFFIAPIMYFLIGRMKHSTNELEVYFDRLVQKLGIEKKQSEGPLDYLNRLKLEDRLTNEVQEILNLYIQIKYAEKKENVKELLVGFKRKVKLFKS